MWLFTGRGLPPIPHYAAVGGIPCDELSVALFIAKLSALPKRLAVFALHICPRQPNIPQHLIIERGQMPTSACQITPIEDHLDRPAHKPASRHRRGQAPFKCFGCSRCHDRSPVFRLARCSHRTEPLLCRAMAVRITRHVYPADFETAEFMFQSFPPPPCHRWYVENQSFGLCNN